MRRLLRLSKHEFASLKITQELNSISIQQVSPVPRQQRTIIRYQIYCDYVLVESVNVESADGLYTPEEKELREDVIHFIESFLY